MIPTELEMARSGEFMREYGTKYFIAVSEALNIGRVKVEMVPIGSSGQNGIAFYLTTEKMQNLCAEILDGTFAKKLAADTGGYPTAYQYVTGDDGSLRLNIGSGKAGPCVQMQNSKHNLRYIMGVSRDALTTMARKYMLCSGLTPVMVGTYYSNVVRAFELGRSEREQYRKPTNEELGDVIDASIVAAQSEPATNDKTSNKEDAKEKKQATENTASEAKNKPKKDENATEVRNYVLKVKGVKTTKKGFYAFDSVDENGNAVSLLFRKEDANSISWFSKFENAAANGTELKFSGEKKNSHILYKGPAKN